MSTATHKKMSYALPMTYARKQTSSNTLNRSFLANDCTLTVAIEMLSGRWTTQVLFNISFGDNRFSMLKKKMPGISDQILGLRINHLVENDLIVKEEVDGEKVYTLTPKAEKLMVILKDLAAWQGGCKG